MIVTSEARLVREQALRWSGVDRSQRTEGVDHAGSAAPRRPPPTPP